MTSRSCGACTRGVGGDPFCFTMPSLNYIGMRPDGSKAIRQGETAVSLNVFGRLRRR
jgi:aryl-alcohol dehydrogenase